VQGSLPENLYKAIGYRNMLLLQEITEVKLKKTLMCYAEYVLKVSQIKLSRQTPLLRRRYFTQL